MIVMKFKLNQFDGVRVGVPAVADDDDGVMGAKGHVVESGLLPGDDGLRANRMVLVHMKVKNMNLAVDSHGGKDRT